MTVYLDEQFKSSIKNKKIPQIFFEKVPNLPITYHFDI